MPTPDEATDMSARSRIVSELPPDPHRLPAQGEWFSADAERHLLDRPKFCPMCGENLEADGGITTEYWAGDTRNFMTWFGDCGWFGEVVRFDMVTIQEEEH